MTATDPYATYVIAPVAPFDPEVAERVAALTGHEIFKRLYGPGVLGGNYLAAYAEGDRILADVRQVIDDACAVAVALAKFLTLIRYGGNDLAEILQVHGGIDETPAWLAAEFPRPADEAPRTATPDFARTDYTAYLPGIDENERLAIFCEDCNIAQDTIWTDAEAAKQVTPISVANFIAICDEHHREHHAGESQPADRAA